MSAGECLILCLGNDVRKDDGVGLRVADLLEEAPPVNALIRRSGMSGLYLLDELLNAQSAIIVDSVKTGQRPPGYVYSCRLDDLHSSAGPSPHSVGLPAVMALGRASGLALPRDIRIVAVEVEDMETIEEGLTPRVAESVERAAAAVREILQDKDVHHGDTETRRLQRKP